MLYRSEPKIQDLPLEVWASVQKALTPDEKRSARSACNSLRYLANSTTTEARLCLSF